MELMKSMTSSEQNASALHETVPDLQNEAQTCAQTSTPAAQRRSRPVRFRLIDIDGFPVGIYDTAQQAAEAAAKLWSGVEQRNHENGRDGWDLEAVK
jgi:hypothetical protein